MVQHGRSASPKKEVALMQRFCQAFASAGVGESRSGEDVEDDDSGAVCSSCYLSREADQDAICVGGRLDRWRLWRAVLMRRPRAGCVLREGASSVALCD